MLQRDKNIGLNKIAVVLLTSSSIKDVQIDFNSPRLSRSNNGYNSGKSGDHTMDGNWLNSRSFTVCNSGYMEVKLSLPRAISSVSSWTLN